MIKDSFCDHRPGSKTQLLWPNDFTLECVHAKSLQPCPTLCNPMNHSLPGSSVHGILRQEYWSGLPCPPLGDCLNPGIEPTALTSPALAGMFFTASATWEASAEKQTRFTKRHAPDCSQQCCSQSPEMPVNRRMEKGTAVCSHNRICHSKEKSVIQLHAILCEFHKDDMKDRSQRQEFCTVWFHQKWAKPIYALAS